MINNFPSHFQIEYIMFVTSKGNNFRQTSIIQVPVTLLSSKPRHRSHKSQAELGMSNISDFAV